MYIYPQPFKCAKDHETWWPTKESQYGKRPYCTVCAEEWLLANFAVEEDPTRKVSDYKFGM